MAREGNEKQNVKENGSAEAFHGGRINVDLILDFSQNRKSTFCLHK
jgi:hypothetical protein